MNRLHAIYRIVRLALTALAAVCAAGVILSAAAHGLAGLKRASDAVPGLVRWPL